jgi:hypothetical protein
MYGSSTGRAPSQVNNSKTLNKHQIIFFKIKLKAVDLKADSLKKGNKYSTATERARAKTPPNLFGVARKIAYANKKYHSGWIWRGVTKGLAGMKFSESPKSHGLIMHR